MRACVALEEHIGAANVRHRAQRKEQEQEHDREASHRRTLRIASPSHRPNAELAIAAMSAWAMPLVRASSGTNPPEASNQLGCMKYGKSCVANRRPWDAGDCRNVANGHSTATS